MEWAAGGIVLPRFFQRHMAVNDLDHVDARQQLGDEIIWDHNAILSCLRQTRARADVAVLLASPFVNASMWVGLRWPCAGPIIAHGPSERQISTENLDFSDGTIAKQLYAKNGVSIGARLPLLLKSTKHNKRHIARVEYG